MSETQLRTMEIRGHRYVELRPDYTMNPDQGLCAQCDFCGNQTLCSEAIHKASHLFGGDCIERDVVYVLAHKGKD